MLKRLFLRKSKEILYEVESAERTLKVAQEKIDSLKKDDKFQLLREEVLRLFYESGNISLHNQMMMAQRFQGIGQDAFNAPHSVLEQIKECLDAMEELTKEKDNAISKRKESIKS